MPHAFYWDDEKQRYHVYSTVVDTFHIANCTAEQVLEYEALRNFKSWRDKDKIEVQECLAKSRAGDTPFWYPPFKKAVNTDVKTRQESDWPPFRWDMDPVKELAELREEKTGKG